MFLQGGDKVCYRLGVEIFLQSFRHHRLAVRLKTSESITQEDGFLAFLGEDGDAGAGLLADDPGGNSPICCYRRVLGVFSFHPQVGIEQGGEHGIGRLVDQRGKVRPQLVPGVAQAVAGSAVFFKEGEALLRVGGEGLDDLVFSDNRGAVGVDRAEQGLGPFSQGGVGMAGEPRSLEGVKLPCGDEA